MQLGAEGVFVGSGIFKSEDPERRARAIVEATTHFRDPARVAAASRARPPMESLETSKLEPSSCWPPRLVAPGPRVGVLALQGDFAAHVECSRELGAVRARCACRLTSRGSTRSCCPGGESTTMTLGIEREGLGEPLRALAAAGAPILGTCAGHDHARPRAPRRARRPAAAQRLRTPAAVLRGRPRDRGDSGNPCTRSSSARPGCRRPVPTSTCSPTSTATRSRCARATSWRSPSTRSYGERRLHELGADVGGRRGHAGPDDVDDGGGWGNLARRIMSENEPRLRTRPTSRAGGSFLRPRRRR